MTSFDLPLTRAFGLERLWDFAPKAGIAYARNRNLALPGHPHVSGLSPFLRYRLTSEAEVLAFVHDQHAKSAEKFVAEVLWRSYWKGFLELRPGLWSGYKRDRDATLNRIAVESGLRRQWEDACSGTTGIKAFDHWAKELAETGYLHNHVRMWFASIWIFTLRLPWELGADFFLRHLIDGDPASNTLSWRWVAGLHTPGKTYAATAENIAKNTHGQFAPDDLSQDCTAVEGQPNPPPAPLLLNATWDPQKPSLLLVHEDDLSPEWLLRASPAPTAVLLTHATDDRSPLKVNPKLTESVKSALIDCETRLRAGLPDGTPCLLSDDPESDLPKLLAQTGAKQVITPHAPCGWMADRLARLEASLARYGTPLVQITRDFDRALWPAATHGFFRFREAVEQKALQFRS